MTNRFSVDLRTREGRNEYARLWRRLHREKINKHNSYRRRNDKDYNIKINLAVASSYKKRLEITRNMVYKKLGNKCRICGESERCCLSVHHINPNKKTYRGDSIMRVPQLKKYKCFLTQLDNLILVCENCHRKIHAGKIKSP